MITNEFLSTDGSPPQIILQIDHSLSSYFSAGMQRDHITGDPFEELAAFLANLLNDTAYPFEAHRIEPNVIKLSYLPKAFADPIF